MRGPTTKITVMQQTRPFLATRNYRHSSTVKEVEVRAEATVAVGPGLDTILLHSLTAQRPTPVG